ncbi:hypothetical protein [Phenylobacterium soli]|uniref:Uncharacterized protein n=1 Tax=Phenylobacterium soli TaxID=2170551 RepID=A0A328AG85_9CAUL|nr:hypothetical protein [Phenylobacterium soli]RAK53116.1 hypothetical protein DJ017_00490 [Phenylobacterium soli]
METDAEMMERHGRLLARFAEQAAELADDLHAAALAAEAPEEKRAHHLAFHRMGRALRQTIALEARLRHDARRQAQAAAEAGRKAAIEDENRRIGRRRAYLQAAVTRLVWDEHEQDEDRREALTEHLDAFLAEDVLEDGFAEAPVETQLRRLCDELGLAFPGWSPNPSPSNPPLGGRWSEGPEGVEARSPLPTAPQPPQSFRDSSPSGGALDEPDRDVWNSA